MEEVWKLTECLDAYASLSDVLERKREQVEVKRRREIGKSEVTRDFARFLTSSSKSLDFLCWLHFDSIVRRDTQRL